MSTLKVDAIRHNSATSDAITTAADGTCTAKLTSIGGGQLSHRNLIINGAMTVAQRGGTSTTNGYGTVDRFRILYNGTDEAPTQEQVDVASGTTPYTSGFRKAYKITNGNQTGGAGGGDYIIIRTLLEAQDIANSGWNYSSSSSNITLSFWVKSSVAQNFYGNLVTYDGTVQNYAFETGSLSADTWTKITKTIPGNSNLTFDNNSEAGIRINILPFFGPSYTGSMTLNQWAAYSGSAQTPANTSTWYTTNDATFEITGVQLEVGDTATTFEHRSYKEELRRCYRYFQRRTSSDNYQWVSLVSFYSGSEIHGFFDHYETMRASPTLSADTGSNTLAVQRAGGSVAWSTGIIKNGGNLNVTYFYRDGVSLGTSGQCGRCLTWTAGCTITLSAEL